MGRPEGMMGEERAAGMEGKKEGKSVPGEGES